MNNVTQPEMTSDHGVVLTIGIRTSGDRCAIVMPIGTDNSSTDKKTLCDMACADAETGFFVELCSLLSDDAYVSFVEAMGMDDGFVPHRIDYAAADHPGATVGEPETSQVGALMIFYSDPADLAPGGRVRVGKNTIPGIADADLVGNAIQSALVTKLDALAQILAEGWTCSGSGGGKWYRVVSAPAKGSQAAALVRVGSWLTRGYSATQRRRLIPH